jgi:uncharacterized integral membrane protein
MSSSEESRSGGLAPRQIVGIVIAAVSLLLIAVNWEETEVSLVVAQVTMPLAVLLAVVFLGGMATGAMVFRRRAAKKASR